MIAISGLQKHYGKLHILKGITLAANDGCVLGLVGPNACGKTTLMKCVLGLTHFSLGSIAVQGHDVKSGTEYRRLVGYMPQNPDFPPNLRVREVFKMMEDLHGAPATYREALIESFSLEDSLDKTFEVLSGGTKQKVAVVVAFMFERPVFILDEPTVGLDPVSAAQFKELVRERAKAGATVLIVSHVLSELEQVASEIAFIFEGTVLAVTSMEDLKNKSLNSSLDHAVIEIFSQKMRDPK